MKLRIKQNSLGKFWLEQKRWYGLWKQCYVILCEMEAFKSIKFYIKKGEECRHLFDTAEEAQKYALEWWKAYSLEVKKLRKRDYLKQKKSISIQNINCKTEFTKSLLKEQI